MLYCFAFNDWFLFQSVIFKYFVNLDSLRAYMIMMIMCGIILLQWLTYYIYSMQMNYWYKWYIMYFYCNVIKINWMLSDSYQNVYLSVKELFKLSSKIKYEKIKKTCPLIGFFVTKSCCKMNSVIIPAPERSYSVLPMISVMV